MKTPKWLLLGAFGVLAWAFPNKVQAGTPVFESQVIDLSPSTGTYCQSISTSAYTQVPPASVGNYDRRNGIVILPLPANTADMGGIVNKGIGGIGSQPTGITQYNLLFKKGSAQTDLQVGDNLYLWLISLHTSAETVCWQEYRQR